MRTEKPQIVANAETISYVKIGISNFGMLRLDDCFDQYVYGPEFIGVQYTADSDEIRLYEMVTVLDLDEDFSLSYGVYAEDDLESTNFAIYRIKWNRKQDKEYLINNYNKQKKATIIPEFYPDMQVEIAAIKDSKDIELLITGLKYIDRILLNGYRLTDSNMKDDGSYMGIKRQFYWGQVECSWNRSRENKELEYAISLLSQSVMRIMGEKKNDVYNCRIGYSDRMGLL